MIISIPDIYNQGWRHELAREIWAAAASFWAPFAEVDFFPHSATHKNALDRWWQEAHENRPDKISIFTEADFLPLPTFMTEALQLGLNHHLVAPMARHRHDGNSEPPDHSELTGGWLVIGHPAKVGGLSFGGGDPASRLPQQFPVHVLKGEWDDPGLTYPRLGTHTFWSRAWHDDAPFGGGAFDPGKIRAKIDEHLAHYRRIWNV